MLGLLARHRHRLPLPARDVVGGAPTRLPAPVRLPRCLHCGHPIDNVPSRRFPNDHWLHIDSLSRWCTPTLYETVTVKKGSTRKQTYLKKGGFAAEPRPVPAGCARP